MSEAIILKIRGEDVGTAYGPENVWRAEQFLCDRLSRSVRTPWWALSSDPSTGASSGHHETNPGGALSDPDVPLSNLARGTTGCGDDGAFD